MAKDSGGQTAYGAQPWDGDPWAPIVPQEPAVQQGQPGEPAQPGQQEQPGQPGRQPGRRATKGVSVAIVAVVFGLAGLAVSLWGVATQVLPRQFTEHQQQQILDWEIGKHWRVLSAGSIFPAAVRYKAPSVLGGKALMLTARRIGIARQASCPAATDPAVAAVLARYGCQAVLRATYADVTDTYAVTVGVAVFSASAQASAAQQAVSGISAANAGQAGPGAPGVLTVPFGGTPAAWFTDGRRQLSASFSAGDYVVFYAAGYTGKRPLLPVAADGYADAEMTSVGVGVAQAVLTQIDAPVRQPACPGTPGC